MRQEPATAREFAEWIGARWERALAALILADGVERYREGMDGDPEVGIFEAAVVFRWATRTVAVIEHGPLVDTRRSEDGALIQRTVADDGRAGSFTRIGGQG